MTPPRAALASSPPAGHVAGPPAAGDHVLEPSPPGHQPGAVRVEVLWWEGAFRPVRVSRDRWVTVEEAARLARRAKAVIRERARRVGVVRVGEGRPGSPYRYRLSDLAPELVFAGGRVPPPGLPADGRVRGGVGASGTADRP